MYKTIVIMICLLLARAGAAWAQPFTLKSVNEPKPFRLQLYYGTAGKGALVQYRGQKEVLPLRLRSVVTDSSGRKDGQPDTHTYVWDELVNGKLNGSYGITEGLRSLSGAWYQRGKDGKRFDLALVEEDTSYDGEDKYLLHGVLLSFNHFHANTLTIAYPSGITKVFPLEDAENPDAARQSHIADYNFDGYDDIAFSIPDAGMGVYRMFSIWLYNPHTKTFALLPEPVYNKANCSCLCDVTLDAGKRLLYTACRGGARWWRDVYRFSGFDRLLWQRSEDVSGE